MSEANQAQDNARQFNIQRIYLKDVSFEAPNAPESFTIGQAPKVELNLSSAGRHLGNDVHEVELKLTVTAKHDDKTAFLVEVTQAGLFLAKGFNEEELGHMVGSFCPNTLFPYAREAISDLVTKGTFPQLLLAPVNFDALYQQSLAKRQAEAAKAN